VNRRAIDRRYDDGEKGKARYIRYNTSPKGRERKRIYAESPKGKEAKRRGRGHGTTVED
jgi:hypothetical protein